MRSAASWTSSTRPSTTTGESSPWRRTWNSFCGCPRAWCVGPRRSRSDRVGRGRGRLATLRAGAGVVRARYYVQSVVFPGCGVLPRSSSVSDYANHRPESIAGLVEAIGGLFRNPVSSVHRRCSHRWGCGFRMKGNSPPACADCRVLSITTSREGRGARRLLDYQHRA